MIDANVLDGLTDAALQALQQPPGLKPSAAAAAITLLLGRYVATGRDDLRDAAGFALAHGMNEAAAATDRDDRSAWLKVFLDASALSEDARLRESSEMLADALMREWPASGTVESLMRAVEAVLASGASSSEAGSVGRIAAAVDEMERIVGLAYTPGRGIAHALGQSSEEGGTLGDHAAAASALLTAYTLTGRLPYGMLAEELTQFARRRWWDAERGTFPESWAAQCEAARVFCRLAALHADADYRTAAIVGDADYAADAERALASLAPACRERGDRAAICGLALMELFALSNLK